MLGRGFRSGRRGDVPGFQLHASRLRKQKVARQIICHNAVIVLAARPSYRGLRAGRVDENYLQSGDCRSCHADHFASWARTFRSRMTQEARPTSMQGDFTRENTFEYLGVKARMEQRGDRFFMTFNFPDGRTQTVSVDRTVGSRRIEQYLTKQDRKSVV